MSDGIARFKDFSGPDDPITFQIRDQVFTARDDVPLGQVGQLATVGEQLEKGGADAVEHLLALFEKLLEPESYQRFQQAATNPTGKAVIGMRRTMPIVLWLLEQYGLRPTQASSGSGDTSSENGANSTDGAQPEASTSSPSPAYAA